MTQDNDYFEQLPLSADEVKVKGARRRRMRVIRSFYDMGTTTDPVPPVGTAGSGGGVVTSVSGSTFTVEFPGGSTPSYVELPGTDTTIIHEHIVAAPEGSGSGFGFFLGGSGPFIGQAIEGGGVV